MAESLFDVAPHWAQPPERQRAADLDRIAEVLERHRVQDVTVRRLMSPTSWWECRCDWQTGVFDPGDERAYQAAKAAAFRHVAEQVGEVLVQLPNREQREGSGA